MVDVIPFPQALVGYDLQGLPLLAAVDPAQGIHLPVPLAMLEEVHRLQVHIASSFNTTIAQRQAVEVLHTALAVEIGTRNRDDVPGMPAWAAVFRQQLTQQATQMGNQINQQFNQINQQLDQIDQRLNQTNQRLDQIDQRLDQTNQRLDQIDQRLNQTDQQLNQIDQRIHTLQRECAQALIININTSRSKVHMPLLVVPTTLGNPLPDGFDCRTITSISQATVGTINQVLALYQLQAPPQANKQVKAWMLFNFLGGIDYNPRIAA